jgi:hypothetical protein
LLFLVGLPFSGILSKGDRDRRFLVVLVWLWFLLPVATVMIGRVPIYNNFRHLLFALPPAFIIMGYGAWKLFEVLRSPLLRAGMVVVALAPGIVGIVRLHPYEYIYYNELVGGVRGAEGLFALDYWCTSFREAMAFVNQAAEPGDRVALGIFQTATSFARDDIQLVTLAAEAPDFVLACRRGTGRPSLDPGMETAFEVRSDGVLLAVVTQPRQDP